MSYNPLLPKDLKKVKTYTARKKPKNLKSQAEHINLRGFNLSQYKKIDIEKMQHLATILRGLIFATVEASQSGHPGGSSSKVEQFLALVLGGQLSFDPINPKHSGRDRVVWSAGHCTPLLYSGQALIYEALRRTGRQFSEAVINCVFPENLLRFRHIDGLPGHAESTYPLCDYSTGPSGHGLSAAAGLALSHKSSGLPTKVWVFMGDTESEEGITYEARNILRATGTDNIIVSLDYNHFGIDGPIEEVMPEQYIGYWQAMGWNIIEVDGHNINELLYGYDLAAKGFKNNRPTVVISHTIKGKDYGNLENTAASHGSVIKHSKYLDLMNDLGFKIDGVEGYVALDIEKVLEKIAPDDCIFIEKCLIKSANKLETEAELIDRMKRKLPKRLFVNPRAIKRPKKLPAELIFKSGSNVGMREASSAWFTWLMKQTAFFYAGSGDLSKSTKTDRAENVWGIISPKNQFGRGIRFGIAEQNMAMMSAAITQDILPGDFQPVSVFGTYGVFSVMYGHMIRLALVNNRINPKTAGFFIVLASHDGPDTGPDGQTHQGIFWHSLFTAYPGIKVYKPTDANEVIEMLFFALEIGEPIVLSIPRSDSLVLTREKGVSSNVSVSGAYVFKSFKKNNKKKIVLAVCGSKLLENTLETIPELEKSGLNIKVIVVTSPELFLDFKNKNKNKKIAKTILSDKEKEIVLTLHNGGIDFLADFSTYSKYSDCSIGISQYLKSGTAEEVYEYAQLDSPSIFKKIIECVSLKNKI